MQKVYIYVYIFRALNLSDHLLTTEFVAYEYVIAKKTNRGKLKHTIEDCAVCCLLFIVLLRLSSGMAILR